MAAEVNGLGFAAVFTRQIIGTRIGQTPQPLAVNSDLVNGGATLGLALEAEENFLRVVREVDVEVHTAAKCFLGLLVDDRVDTMFFRRVGRIFQHINPTAGVPLVTSIVNVDALVITPFGKEDGAVEIFSKRLGSRSEARKCRQQCHDKDGETVGLFHRCSLLVRYGMLRSQTPVRRYSLHFRRSGVRCQEYAAKARPQRWDWGITDRVDAKHHEKLVKSWGQTDSRQ